MRSLSLLAVAVLPLLAVCGADTPAAGTVKFEMRTSSAFDVYTSSPTSAVKAWMPAHFWRFQTDAPYFNSQLSWMPNSWVYIDSYAIYTNASVATGHPDWILTDASGKKLYIPWGCSSGTCPQYAADISDPAFRSWWISSAAAQLAAGYKGIWIDDVNLESAFPTEMGKKSRPLIAIPAQP